ncbi:MAG: endonuclease/exonuclease/phosphatase family protein [Treponema sp.]
MKRYCPLFFLFCVAAVLNHTGCFQKPAEPSAAIQQSLLPSGSLRIFAIQGTGHESPLKDKPVQDVPGIVTAITYSKGQPSGFYMQDPEGDGNPASSDALYVYCGAEAFPAGLNTGDLVTVSGTVTEFAYKPKNAPLEDLPVTQITAPAVRLLSSNHALPPPIELKAAQFEKPVFLDDLTRLNPDAEALDFYESLEGMRVCVTNPRVVAAPYNGTHYIAPADAQGFSVRGGMMYNSYAATARLCLYPKKCFARLSDAGVASPLPSIGDSYRGTITGILGYGYGNYQIEPAEPLPPLIRSAVWPETSSALFSPQALNLVSYNLENFSYGNTKKSHSSKKTAAERAAAFAGQLITGMKAPDLICLIEVQDDSGEKKDDGVVSARKTLDLLTAELEKRRPGAGYKAVAINPTEGMDGGAPGANIRCAYLYRSDRLELVPDRDGKNNSRAATQAEIDAGGLNLIQNPARIGLGNPAFKHTRKSLAAHFRFKTGINGGKDFFVINNHLTSKRGDGKIWGRNQPVIRSSEVKRHRQAEAVAAFIKSITAVRPDAVIISAGDYNDFWFSKTIDIFKAAGMHNAIEVLPEHDRYTYVYDGHSQTLDNIMVTRNVRIAHVDILHVNAELPQKERLSDHDPIFVQLRLDQ